MTPKQLRDFESSIADTFNEGKIRAPVHLYDGCEEEMIAYFKEFVKPLDWIACTWRSHYQCLLKGVPADELRAEILAGHSISLCFPKYRVISSAIAGGCIPIALGIALGIKRSGGAELVHCWVGDMMARSGIFHECLQYANNFELPIKFVIEDNGLSVCTDTNDAWGKSFPDGSLGPGLVTHYSYDSIYPHAGAGKRVQF